MGFLPYFVRLIHVFSFPASVVRGTQRLLSVKYLFGEANVAYRIFYYLRTPKKTSYNQGQK